jgi:hypothetical protein
VDYPIAIQPGQDPATKIAAAAGGLIGGLNDYARYQSEKQLATQKMQAGLLSQGLITDQDGNVTRGPVAQQQYQQSKDELDPNSETSRQFRQYGQGLLSKAGLDQGLIEDPDENGEGGTSAYTVKQMIQEAKPAVTGEYGLLGRKATTDLNSDKATATTLNKDPILTPYITRADGAKKILNLMDAAQRGEFKSNKALLGQLNAEIARLETGSQSPGLGAGEKTEMNDSAAALHDYLDTLTGKVTGVDLGEKFQQARGMVHDLGSSYLDQINNRMDYLKSHALPGQGDTYDASKDQFQKSYAAFAPQSQGKGLIPTPQPTADDQAAIQWAKQNPNDPRSASILKLQGMAQ